jgi:virginiamycin B lyase
VATAGYLQAYAPILVTPGTYTYTVPTSDSGPAYIALGPDGNLWFTEEYASKIGVLSPAGGFTEYSTPTASAGPQDIVSGSDGRLWFAEYNASKLGAVTTAGTITEHPTLFGSPDDPYFLTDRGDGNMWYTGNGADRIGYEGETTGVAGETTLPESPTQVSPTGIAPASDGYIYFAEAGNGKIGRLHDLFGTVQEITVPTPSGSSTGPNLGQMVAGPDGNLWVVDTQNSQIDRVNIPSFTVTQFQTASPSSGPTGIVAGPDGALWFTESFLDRIGRITTNGTATDYPLYAGAPGSQNLGLTGIAFGPDYSIYFTEKNKNAIGRLIP